MPITSMNQYLKNKDERDQSQAVQRQRRGVAYERKYPTTYVANTISTKSAGKSFVARLAEYIGGYNASEVDKELRAKLPLDLYFKVTEYPHVIGEDLKKMSPTLHKKYVGDVVKLLQKEKAEEAQADRAEIRQNRAAIEGARAGNAQSAIGYAVDDVDDEPREIAPAPANSSLNRRNLSAAESVEEVEY